MSTDELPLLEPFIEKCGKGTAWIGGMIREQMRAYGQQCRSDALFEAAALCDCDEGANMNGADLAAVLRAKAEDAALKEQER